MAFARKPHRICQAKNVSIPETSRQCGTDVPGAIDFHQVCLLSSASLHCLKYGRQSEASMRFLTAFGLMLLRLIAQLKMSRYNYD
jgi:hypothetical protein